MRRLSPVLALSLALAACNAPKSSLPATDAPVTAPPTAAELASFATSNNAFALDLYGKLRARNGNLAFSPMSISTALTMTWAGARGETAAQMAKGLHAQGTGAQAADAAGKLVGSYRDPARKTTLRVANRLFGEKTYAFEPAYLDLTRTAFGAPLQPLDFKHDFEDSRRLINGWVAGQTLDRVKDLLPPRALDDQTRLVLTNAVYFLGDWATPFRKESTSPAAFHVTVTESESVPTMHATESFRFATASGVKLLEMSYEGAEVAMTVVLPDAASGLDAVEQSLTPAVLDGWLAGLHSQQVIVSLPRFKIDPAESLSLGEPLQALGMALPFDRDHADFTGMANPPIPADRLYLARVFHKAFVKVDEKGTEAAAGTAVVMAREGGEPPTTQPAEFRADHPFLFLLRDLRSGTILFLGRVSDPAAR
jgi:serpin B